MASSPQRSRDRREAPVYHIVAHTHWDREWYQPFEVFRARLVECIDSLLEILDRDPAFSSFLLDGQASVIDDYLEIRPERETELRRRITEGRIFTGPWYTLPDEFLVSGEALVRNLLHGTRRARDMGHSMSVGYVPDSFGHVAAMPAIFHGFGLSHAVTWRGFGGEPGQDVSEWTWRAADGSAVLMHHLYPDGYSAATFTGMTVREAFTHFQKLRTIVDRRATTRHRLLLSGGDHHFPDATLPGMLAELRRATGSDIRVSSLEEFFSAVEEDCATTHVELSELSGELHFGYRYAFVVSSGVYSSRISIKQQNAAAQRLLVRYAEPLLAMAGMAGDRADTALLDHAWTLLLRNHAHDSICGCSVDAVHDEMATRFASIDQLGNHLVQTALETLVPSGAQKRGDDRTILIFNPSARERSDVARCRVEFYQQDVVVGLNPDVRVAPKLPAPRGWRVKDASGRDVRFQILREEEAFGIVESRSDYPKQSIVHRAELLVEPGRLPGMSLSSLAVATTQSAPRFRTRLRATGRRLSNDILSLTVERNGSFVIVDKIHGTAFRGLLMFEDGGDAGDEYSYSPPRRDARFSTSGCKARVIVVERGPLRATLEIRVSIDIPRSSTSSGRSRQRASTEIVSRVSLYEHSPVVHVESSFTNASRDHRLRAIFHTGIFDAHSHADQHFGTVRRAHVHWNTEDFTIEHPSPVHAMQRFVTVRDEVRAFTLFADGLPEYEWEPGSGVLALTMLRCVGELSRGDLITRPGGDAGWKNATPGAQCLGEHRSRFAFVCHNPDSAVDVELWAEQVLAPLLASASKATMRIASSALEIENPAVVFSTMKPAANGEVVVRMYNSLPEAVTSSVLVGDSIRRVWRSRLDEAIREPLRMQRGRVVVRFGPYEIVTLLLAPRSTTGTISASARRSRRT